MGKILLTSSNIMNYVREGSTEIIVTPEMILTPGAKDACRIKKIKICYGDGEMPSMEMKQPSFHETARPVAEKGDEDDTRDIPLDHRIKQMLRKEFNIISEVEVWNITKKVLEELEKH